MRNLASIKEILDVFPIENADNIEAVTVDGWNVVVKKNQFKVGDKCVYFEIDSFLNGSDERFKFLSKNFIQYNDTFGLRLRTMRLRGQLSQGLVMPLDQFPEVHHCNVNDDVTEILGVTKWEPSLPACLGGEVEGLFPSFITKTDQTRVQSLKKEISQNVGQEFEVTIKLDGSSMTVFRNDHYKNKNGEIVLRHGVCSRNLSLYENDDNTLWAVTKRNRLIEALDYLNRNLAFQGELIGEGIAGNNENIKGQDFYIFDIFDIDNQKYLSPVERQNIVKTLQENGFDKVKHVPILDNVVLNHSIQDLLNMADGPSMNGKNREGLVFKRLDGQFSFKAISNWYLERHSDR